jgi:hypothetical protein
MRWILGLGLLVGFPVLAEDGPAIYGRAVELQKAGKHREAIAAYERALELGVKNPAARFNLACAHAKVGDREKALSTLEALVAETGFDDAELLEKDADLAALRGERRFAAVVAAARKSRAPCKERPEHRAFDFWVGEWEVRDPAGQKIGTSRVERILGDCVLLENWTDGFGHQGKSFNVLDVPSGKWRQTWVDDRGGLHQYTGAFEGKALVHHGTWAGRDGKRFDVRMTFTPVEGGKVRQVMERTRDGGKTWESLFDGLYVPAKLAR